MALGGDTNRDADSSASALLRRWYRLRDRCCSQLSQATDPESLQNLGKKLNKLEKDIISYEKEQDSKGDPFWLGKSAFKMFIDIRETISNFRDQLESLNSCIEPDVPAEAFEDPSVFDVLEEEEFLLTYESVDDEKPEVRSPTARFHSTRTLRMTLQGSIMFGIDGDTNEYVALKISSKDAVFKQQSLSGERVIEDPINEVRLLEQLNVSGHRNIIRLIDSLEDEENYWMVMEYCSGGELFDHVCENGRLDEDSAALYFLQLARALDFIHSNGVCHLDLSLENIILTDTGVLKLTDFGLARQFEKSTVFSGCHITKPGKIGYMSPEIFAGQDFNGGQADMYSAGVVLFVMLFGCPPYEIPAPCDRRFRLIFYGEIRELLHKWQISTSPLALDLLSRLLCAADERLSAQDVLEHPWLSHRDISG